MPVNKKQHLDYNEKINLNFELDIIETYGSSEVH